MLTLSQISREYIQQEHTFIYLVRHGETNWNRHPKRYQGRKDIPLNDTGLSQAHCLAQYFKNKKIDYIFSSPLQRTASTAVIINRFHSLPINYFDDLTEMNFGDWEGSSVEGLAHQDPDLWELWTNDPDKVQIPNGEKLHDFFRRCRSVIDRIRKYNNGPKLLVTHGAFIRAFMICMLKRPSNLFNKIPQLNGAITLVLDQTTPKLLIENFSGHLGLVELGDKQLIQI